MQHLVISLSRKPNGTSMKSNPAAISGTNNLPLAIP